MRVVDLPASGPRTTQLQVQPSKNSKMGQENGHESTDELDENITKEKKLRLDDIMENVGIVRDRASTLVR